MLNITTGNPSSSTGMNHNFSDNLTMYTSQSNSIDYKHIPLVSEFSENFTHPLSTCTKDGVHHPCETVTNLAYPLNVSLPYPHAYYSQHQSHLILSNQEQSQQQSMNSTVASMSSNSNWINCIKPLSTGNNDNNNSSNNNNASSTPEIIYSNLLIPGIESTKLHLDYTKASLTDNHMNEAFLYCNTSMIKSSLNDHSLSRRMCSEQSTNWCQRINESRSAMPNRNNPENGDCNNRDGNHGVQQEDEEDDDDDGDGDGDDDGDEDQSEIDEDGDPSQTSNAKVVNKSFLDKARHRSLYESEYTNGNENSICSESQMKLNPLITISHESMTGVKPDSSTSSSPSLLTSSQWPNKYECKSINYHRLMGRNSQSSPVCMNQTINNNNNTDNVNDNKINDNINEITKDGISENSSVNKSHLCNNSTELDVMVQNQILDLPYSENLVSEL
uniref:Uncharacterized protein n=1 Tax=Trichobilharzia regenti TaxID=157069 RepID=A0AA85JAS7_TRIRE|nr:unnamed protein product [Trichobilharzia regenti]